MTSGDRTEIEQFLFREARLLDERAFKEWESLWTDDGVYWVPAEHGDYDPSERISIIYDDRATLALRIARLTGSDAHAESPTPAACRVVSNVEIEPAILTGGRAEDIGVYSVFVAVTVRRGREQFWSGRVTHHLRRAETGDLLIAYKRVTLINCDTFLSHLPFLP